LTYFFLSRLRIEYPGARLPWRLMAQVLGVAARELGDPVAIFVLTKACDRGVALRHRGVAQSGPSV